MLSFWLGVYLGGYIVALRQFEGNDDLPLVTAGIALIWPLEFVVIFLSLITKFGTLIGRFKKCLLVLLRKN